jgi:hypothetical protein
MIKDDHTRKYDKENRGKKDENEKKFNHGF